MEKNSYLLLLLFPTECLIVIACVIVSLFIEKNFQAWLLMWLANLIKLLFLCVKKLSWCTKTVRTEKLFLILRALPLLKINYTNCGWVSEVKSFFYNNNNVWNNGSDTSFSLREVYLYTTMLNFLVVIEL